VSIINAARGLVADAIDRLAERVSKTPAHQEATRTRLGEFLDSQARDGGRALVAKIARSEVKNYLAELAEQAEIAFEGPAPFLSHIRTMSAAGHYSGCSCHDKEAAK
jgi:hypothetical protein